MFCKAATEWPGGRELRVLLCVQWKKNEDDNIAVGMAVAE